MDQDAKIEKIGKGGKKEVFPQKEAGRQKPDKFFEQTKMPEAGPESRPEGEKPAKSHAEAGIGAAIGAGAAQIRKDKRKKEIEAALAANLDEFYLQMNQDKRREFKIAGEKTAAKINELLDEARIRARKIADLIKKWLSLIPGISRYFLEQETKIKTDEILRIKK